MALFKKSADSDTPEYRVAAFATLDLESQMKKKPFVIDMPGEIDWHVHRDGDEYVAMGEIKIPITMFFRDNPEKETLAIERVAVNGKRVFDTRIKPQDDRDPNHGIDPDKVQAANFIRYKDIIDS